MLSSIIFGLLCGCIVLGVVLRVFPRSAVRLAGLLLVIPTLALALMLPVLHRAGVLHATFAFSQGLLLTIATVFPVGHVMLRRPADLTRTALGLGADGLSRLKLIWLPLLMPSLLMSVVLGIVLSGLCVVLDSP